MFVYFAKTISDPPLVKIGQSDAADFRIDMLQTSCPFKLELLGKLHIGERARAAERGIHERLEAHHSYGEWFQYEPDVSYSICALLPGEIKAPEKAAKTKLAIQTRRPRRQRECPAIPAPAPSPIRAAPRPEPVAEEKPKIVSIEPPHDPEG